MAQNYQCDICQEVAADFMITVIHDGSVQAVGVECLLDWALPIVEAWQAAQARENPTGTQDVTAMDPPQPGTQAAVNAASDAIEAAETAEWEYDHPDAPTAAQEAPEAAEAAEAAVAAEGVQEAPRARKRAPRGKVEDGRTDAEAEASANVHR